MLSFHVECGYNIIFFLVKLSSLRKTQKERNFTRKKLGVRLLYGIVYRGSREGLFPYAGVPTRPPNPNPFSCEIRENDTLSLVFFWVETHCFSYKFCHKVPFFMFLNKHVGKWRIAPKIFKKCRRVIHSLPQNTPFLLHFWLKTYPFSCFLLSKSHPWCCTPMVLYMCI